MRAGALSGEGQDFVFSQGDSRTWQSVTLEFSARLRDDNNGAPLAPNRVLHCQGRSLLAGSVKVGVTLDFPSASKEDDALKRAPCEWRSALMVRMESRSLAAT